MARRFIYSADGSVIRTLHINDDQDWLKGGVFEVEQDADPLLAEVQYQRDVRAAVGKPKDGIQLAALMPIADYERACREGWIRDPVAMKKWVNDPANRAFRVAGSI